jgi:hypothetical protein
VPSTSTASLRPLPVGVVHGLAGSKVIALLVLTTTQDVAQALLYLGVFGVGTIAGMALLTLLVVVPVTAASRHFVALERYLVGLTGAASVAFGVLILLRATLGDGMPWPDDSSQLAPRSRMDSINNGSQ